MCHFFRFWNKILELAGWRSVINWAIHSSFTAQSPPVLYLRASWKSPSLNWLFHSKSSISLPRTVSLQDSSRRPTRPQEEAAGRWRRSWSRSCRGSVVVPGGESLQESWSSWPPPWQSGSRLSCNSGAGLFTVVGRKPCWQKKLLFKILVGKKYLFIVVSQKACKFLVCKKDHMKQDIFHRLFSDKG